MMRGLFISATGTGCGKTWLTRGLARLLTREGRRVAAIKPIETGVGTKGPEDALAIARASGRPELAFASGLVRLAAPVSPLAAARMANETLPAPSKLAERVCDLARGHEVALVEGAGGLLVPLSRDHTIADLVGALGWPLVLVARDALGTLSHTLAAVESAEGRRLTVAAVVLVRGPWSEGDPSVTDNATILQERLSVPVEIFESCHDDDDALAEAVRGIRSVLVGDTTRGSSA